MDLSILSSLVWAAATIFIFQRLERIAMKILSSKDPLNEQQYKELKQRYSDLQTQVSKLSMTVGFKGQDDE